jgi:pimeloyl-ACP methyl ester carboxylesterase
VSDASASPHAAARAAVRLAAWGGVGRTVDLGGPVHYVDFGGPAGAPRVVLVHGLGGSHLNWCLLAPRLAQVLRVLAVDLVGFGLTRPEGRAATVHANVALLDRFVAEVAGAPAILVGNSMGGMISILEAAAQPRAVAALALLDPACRWCAACGPSGWSPACSCCTPCPASASASSRGAAPACRPASWSSRSWTCAAPTRRGSPRT